MTTIYRAITASIAPTGRTTLGDRRPLSEAQVDIVELVDVPASTKIIARETFEVVNEADLAAKCAAHLAVLRARLEAAHLAIDVPGKTIAEVTIVHPAKVTP